MMSPSLLRRLRRFQHAHGPFGRQVDWLGLFLFAQEIKAELGELAP